MLALRLLPAIAGAGAVLVAGLLARELGGGRRAQRLAAAAAFCSPYLLATSHFYSMNVFEWLFISLLALVAARILGRGMQRGWIVFGALAGLALLNKLLVGVFAVGLIGGMLLGPERRELAVWGLAALLSAESLRPFRALGLGFLISFAVFAFVAPRSTT